MPPARLMQCRSGFGRLFGKPTVPAGGSCKPPATTVFAGVPMNASPRPSPPRPFDPIGKCGARSVLPQRRPARSPSSCQSNAPAEPHPVIVVPAGPFRSESLGSSLSRQLCSGEARYPTASSRPAIGALANTATTPSSVERHRLGAAPLRRARLDNLAHLGILWSA
jgi:hypothetical protein